MSADLFVLVSVVSAAAFVVGCGVAGFVAAWLVDRTRR